MYPHRVIRSARLVFAGAVLALWSQMSLAGEWTTGQVTSINLELNKIVISERALTLSMAVKLGQYSQLRTIKPGQGVRYEAEGTVIQRIELVKLPPT